jgi:hypothetical protein
MVRTVSRHELNQLLRRVAALPEVAKFEVFEAVRADLVATLSEAEQGNCLVSERQEAIAAITRVAKHLKLPVGVAPTVVEFNRGARELGLDWNRARVTRAYEKWPNATKAYLGRAPRQTPSQRRMRRRRGFRRRSVESYLNGVRLWLATGPERESMPAYDAWADEANAAMADGESLYVLGQALRNMTTLGWKNIIAVARGEKTVEEATEEETAALLPPRSKHGVIGLTAIARILGVSTQHAKELADGRRTGGFPISVATIQGHRAWLVADIRAYKRGANFAKRTEGELQGEYMDAPELEARSARLGMNHRTLWRCIGEQRWDRVPAPEGFLSRQKPYWLRKKAEKWLADHASLAQEEREG